MKKIVAIAGSIRKESFNKYLCKNLEQLSNEQFTIKSLFLDNIPFFCEDLEENLPETIKLFIQEISEADAVIIATPEYNNMVPGVLKNACEWLSRSYSKHAVEGKPLAIVGASTGGFGTVRAQNQMLLLGSILKFQIFADLRLPVSNASSKFSENGLIIDEDTNEKLKDLVNRLLEKIITK